MAFHGGEADGRHIRMHIGTDDGPDCTDDYLPRTFVLEVGREQLPAVGGFWLTTEREGASRSLPARSPSRPQVRRCCPP